MKEYSLDLTKSLSLGIRHEHRASRNIPGLVICQNAKPLEYGLATIDKIVNPFPDTLVTPSFPFPQIFRGSVYTILAGETSLWYVNEDDWSLTPITTYDAYNTTVAKAIQAGGRWHFVDNGESWILLNGKCQVFRMYYNRIVGSTDKVLVQEDVWINTGCSSRGRTILGGFTQGHFWNSGWQDLWDEFAATWRGGITQNGIDLRENFVLWSDVGGSLFWLLYSTFADSGYIGGGSSGYSSSHKLFFDMLKRNELGWMPMSWKGKVLLTAPLDRFIIVYGEGGITALNPVADPANTYGRIELSEIGINERNLVGTSLHRHIFVDNKGYLWELSSDLKLKKLGYKEYITKLLQQDLSISNNADEDEFYLSGLAETYVLNQFGFYSTNQSVTSIITSKNGSVGILEDLGNRNLMIVTDTFDMGLRASKALGAIEIGANSYDNMQCSVLFKYKQTDLWRWTDWKRVSPNGTVSIPVVAPDFRIAIRVAPYADTEINSLTIRWQLTDKRVIRGIYASST